MIFAGWYRNPNRSHLDIPFQSSLEGKEIYYKSLGGRMTLIWVYLGQPWLALLC